jgi:hypothetical protein
LEASGSYWVHKKIILLFLAQMFQMALAATACPMTFFDFKRFERAGIAPLHAS